MHKSKRILCPFLNTYFPLKVNEIMKNFNVRRVIFYVKVTLFIMSYNSFWGLEALAGSRVFQKRIFLPGFSITAGMGNPVIMWRPRNVDSFYFNIKLCHEICDICLAIYRIENAADAADLFYCINDLKFQK